MAMEKTPLLMSGNKHSLPSAPFTTARFRPGSDVKLPQIIAHRGYKAAYPENTLAAFKAAVDIGAHAVETDIHLSKDKVVVLSHDATLKRCFGIDKKIADCDWEYLSTLETLSEPKQHMPRLADLLAYLAQPENEDIWALVDIKKDDDAHELLTCVTSTIASIQPSGKPWKDRIILGPWDTNYISLCTSLLPLHPQAYISFSIFTSRKLLHTPSLPNLNFNILLFSLLGPGGTRFLRSAKQAGRNVFVWTVNQEEWMEWCIRKGVDGVITDDPKLFREVCERWGSGDERRGWGQLGRRIVAWGIMALLTPAIWMQYRPGVMTRRLVARIQGV